MVARRISFILVALAVSLPWGIAPPGRGTFSSLAAGTCLLNEFLPRPCASQPAQSLTATDSEFIELYNPTSAPLTLDGWALEVACGGSGRYMLPPGTVIAARGYLAFFQGTTGLVLPNEGGACVRLLDAGGLVVDSQDYFTSVCNESYGRLPDGGGWEGGLLPTPGRANARPTAMPTPSSTPSSTATPSRTPSPRPTATSTRTATPTRTLVPSRTATPTRTAGAFSTATATRSRTPIVGGTPSPGATRTPTRWVTPTAIPYHSVCLSEFLPMPRAVDWDGDGTADYRDEWIELYNASDGQVCLAGWALDDLADGGSRPFIFPTGEILAARAYGVYYLRDTGVALNNDGDQVRLIASDGTVIDWVEYRTAEYDASYGRRDGCAGEWVLGWDPSPGQPNRLPPPTPTPQPKRWLYLPWLQRASN